VPRPSGSTPVGFIRTAAATPGTPALAAPSAICPPIELPIHTGRAGARELAGEPIEHVGTHWLGAVEREVPARELERADRVVGDAARAVIVGEARPAAGRHPVARDRLEHTIGRFTKSSGDIK
jgi:hypothetical protein